MYRLGISNLEQPESAQIFFENAHQLKAQSRLRSLGTTWDKRLTYEQWRGIAAEMTPAASPTATEPVETYHEAVRSLTGLRRSQATAGGSATPTESGGTTRPGIDRFHRSWS
jgi:hypothetical protein